MESEIITTEPAITSEAVNSQQPRPLIEIITSQIVLLSSYLPTVLESEDVEAIHKMRVTTRRLQASLDLLQTREDKLKVRKIKRRLRNWRRVLSQVRNYDVFLLIIEKESASRNSARRKSFEHLKAVLQKRRARRLAKARHYLKRISLARICSKLGLDIDLRSTTPLAVESDEASRLETVSVETPPEPPRSPRPELTDERAIALRAAERIEQRLSEFLALVAASHPTNDPAELHQVRIASKRLRYLLEIVSEMGYGDAPRALAWLRRLQDRIGDWHDLVALEEEIISIVSHRKFLKEHIAESSRMLQAASHLQSKKETLVAKLFPLKVPQTLPATSRRLVRSLRRKTTARRVGTRPTGS
jgi:CHAD domain-containing protein